MKEVLGPTLPDLSIRVNADYEVIGRTVGLRVIGNFFVPFLSGMLYDRFPRSKEIAFGIIFIIGGTLEIIVPYCRSVWLLSLILILQGISEGALTTAAQSMIIELFAGQASAALQFMHLGWGLGSFFASLIVRPFLAPNLRLSKGKIRYACLTDQALNVTNSSDVQRMAGDNERSRIEVAFLIIGMYAIFMGSLLFIFSLLPKPVRPNDKDSNANSKKNIKEMLAPGKISDGKPLFGSLMLIGLFMIYTLDVGCYVAYTRYLVTVGMDPCKGFQMTQKQATLLQSMVALSFSLSRIGSGFLLAFMVAKNKSPGIFILICTICMCFCIILLRAIGLRYEVAFWVLSCIYGFVHAPMFGGNTPWFNQYIRVTSTVVAIAVTGSNVGKFLFSWLFGYVLKTYSSVHLMSISIPIMIVLCITAMVCFIASLCVGHRPTYNPPHQEQKRKPVRTDEHSTSEDDDTKI